jgi:RNA polymerase sigma factor (sigma-70 family)
MEGIQPSDAELVRRAVDATTDQQRAEAFEAIADRYRLIILRQCASWYPDPEAAQDIGQAAFEAAFTLLAQGKGPERPDKLAGWLIEIARLRGREYVRKSRPAGVQWADLPEGRGLDETEDDDEGRSGSAARRVHATRLVERVVATFTDRQQEIYQLRFVQELTGREIAGRLGIADKAASNEATIVQGLIADGFGALILMQEGRRYCPDLARILDDAATTRSATTSAFAAAPTGADIFTAVLRQRIVNHFNDCTVCDNCRTCNSKRRQLVGPYVPALIPIVFAGEFRDRIDEVIRRVVEQVHAGHHSSSHPGSSTPAAAAAGGGSAMAGGLPAIAGAGTGTDADALVSRLQSLVHKARESNRLPRWLRRAIPHDAGPGASIAVVVAAFAAVIVAVVVIAAVASALTAGGGPAPQAGAGGTGPAVAGVTASSAGATTPSGTPSAACGSSGEPALAYVTFTGTAQVPTGGSVVVRCGTHTPRTLGSFGTASYIQPTPAWSSDGTQLGWLTASAVYVAQAKAGTWSVRHWACQGCVGMAFLGKQAVTVSSQAAGSALTAAIPQLLVFPATGSGQPATLRVTGITTADGTEFNVLGSVSPADLVVSYGYTGGTAGGSPVLYRVNAAGQATQYQYQPPHPNEFIGAVGNFTVSQASGEFAFSTSGETSAFCYATLSWALDTATGAIISPKTPATGGGPNPGPAGWLVEGIWVDQTGTPYASLAPSPSDCATNSTLKSNGITPIVYKLSGGSWVQTGRGIFQSAYGPGNWLAEKAGVTIQNGAAPATMTISDGTGKTPVTVPNADSFAWAP